MEPNSTKAICIVILFLMCIIMGWLPFFLIRSEGSARSNRIRRVVISYLNCFAGGVFLGASFLHLLAEGSEEMEAYFAQVNADIDFPVYLTIVAGGLFIIALVEQIAMKMLRRSSVGPNNQLDLLKGDVGNKSNRGMDNRGFNDTMFSVSGGAYQQQYRKQPSENVACSDNAQHCAHDIASDHAHNHTSAIASDQSHNCANNAESGHLDNHNNNTAGNHAHAHDAHLTNMLDTMEHAPLRACLLLAALSFHTVFDGLAVGLQNTTTEIWQMFTAIAIHKALVSVSLGLQLFLTFKSKPMKAFFWTFFFSMISPIGIGLGMIISSGHVDDLARMLVSSILQAVATGTFMYVTFFEILHEELVERNGFLRLLFVILGFGGMALAKYFDND